MTKCKKCGASILFIQSAVTKKWIPCDEGLVPYKQIENGKQQVITDRGEAIRCTFEFDGFPTGLARVPHWATCPFADEFRRR